MRFASSRSLVVILVALGLTACSTTTTSEGSAAPAAVPSVAVVAAPPAGEIVASPAAPAPMTDALAPAAPQVDKSGAKVVTPPAPKPLAPAPATPAAPAPTRKLTMDCTSGSKVTGLVDRWSPLSTCPAGYQVTGLGRIDLQGDHNRPNLHVNDFICDDRGCKAWCIGDGCTVEARCCRISD